MNNYERVCAPCRRSLRRGKRRAHTCGGDIYYPGVAIVCQCPAHTISMATLLALPSAFNGEPLEPTR